MMPDPLIVAVTTSTASACGGVLVERLRNARASEADTRRRSAETRRAFRLVERELHEAETRIARSANAGRYGRADRCLATRALADHRGELAGALGVADWYRVTAAYDAISGLNEMLEERVSPMSGGEAENEAQVMSPPVLESSFGLVRPSDQLELRWRAIRTASWILRAYCGDADKAEQALAEDDREAARIWSPPPRAAQGRALPG